MSTHAELWMRAHRIAEDAYGESYETNANRIATAVVGLVSETVAATLARVAEAVEEIDAKAVASWQTEEEAAAECVRSGGASL